MTENYQLINSGIDAAGYYVGNYALHKVSTELPTANMKHTLVYFISDLAVRNSYISMWSDNSMFTGMAGKNAYIAVIAFAANSVIDMLSKRDVKDLLMKNGLRSAVGFGTNTLVDKFVLPVKYV